MPTFSVDWFSHNIPNFQSITNYYKQQNWPIESVLEIGSYEGRSTCWMLENMLSDTGTITCIDPFIPEDPTPFSFDKFDSTAKTKKTLKANTNEVKKSKQKVNIIVDRSFKALAQQIVDQQQYDFIYVDGSHCADVVLMDACMAFPLLKSGGVLLFDDYLWDHPADHLDRCKMSVDSFVNMFAKKCKLVISNYQVAVLKL